MVHTAWEVPGLDAALVDGAREHIRCAEGESRGRGLRGGNTAAKPDAWRPVVCMRRRQLIPQGEHRRQQGDGRTVVGVPAGVGFGRQVRHQGNRRGQFGFLRAEASELRQAGEVFGRRRR